MSPTQINLPWEEIFSAFGDGLVILNEKKHLTGMNPAAESITGFSAESSLGRSLQEAFSANDLLLKRLDSTFENGQAVTLHEMPWLGKGGEAKTIDLSATPLIGEEGNLTGWILVFRDMTPVKNLQEDLRKADRLAMFGTIAAGLAHEIKNPLGGIKGAAQMLLKDRSESAECLDIIIKEADRVNRLIGQLLALGRPKEIRLVPVNLNELLDSILLLEKEPLASRRIRLDRQFDPSLPAISGDVDELRQAFLNFIKNAIEAVPNGHGEIQVKSRLMTDFKIKGAEGKKPARVVMAEIRDNGVGISPEDLEKIFTPFFTTKATGTGLGLAIAQRVVHEHGGMVRVTSEKGEGTVIQIFLRSCE